MAENKKSFILYVDIISTFEELKDAEAGRLIKHLLRYVNDLNPVAPDRLTNIAFEPIKVQLKRDLKHWDVIKKDRSIAGKLGNLKRWHLDLYEKVIDEKMTFEESQNITKQRKLSQNIANVAVNVNDNVTVNDIIKEKEKEKEKEIFLWVEEKKLFLNAYEFKEKICKDKNLKMPDVENFQKEFISDQELKENYEPLKELKNHFINWLNLKLKILKNGTHGKINDTGSKPGTSDARVAALKDWSIGGKVHSSD